MGLEPEEGNGGTQGVRERKTLAASGGKRRRGVSKGTRMKTLEHKDLQLHYSLPSKDRLKDRLTEWRGVVVQYKRRAQSRADQCLYLRL